MGGDVHAAWVVGQCGLREQDADMGLAADWLRTEAPPSDLKGARRIYALVVFIDVYIYVSLFHAQAGQPRHETAASCNPHKPSLYLLSAPVKRELTGHGWRMPRQQQRPLALATQGLGNRLRASQMASTQVCGPPQMSVSADHAANKYASG